MTDLAGKTAIITGAASGIGLAAVETFIDKGARIIASDVQDEKGEALEARFGADKLRYIHCDVTSRDDLTAMMKLADEAFGGFDILYNNAGHGGTTSGVEDLDMAGFDSTMSLTLRSVFEATHLAIPYLKAKGGGSVINTSSISAVCAGYAPITYSVAKKGVAHFSKIAAAELAKFNIRVNAILPGFIATSIFGASFGFTREQADQMAEMLAQKGGEMQPIGRVGAGTDIAEMAAFLASDAASFITGGEFLVDGGMTVGPTHSWSEAEGGPLLEAMGITPEQAEQMAAAAKAAQEG